MPTWSGILNELKQIQTLDRYDRVRRKYIALLHEKTKRNTILYATRWTEAGIPSSLITITEEDIQGLMEVIHGLVGSSLDLILHSPGGSAEATEAFISYLRTKFNDIRVIIPHAAMSAATMLTCSANKILMGKHSFLGPIDPQFILQTQLGLQMVPAQTILDQFERAKIECQDPKKLGSWLPILGQYGPALLEQCQNQINLSKELVSKWLKEYMFAGKEDAEQKAINIANYLSNHKIFKTHGRHINREQAKEIGLTIEDLESDQDLQDLVLSVFHATTHTFNATNAVKIIENHQGRAFIKQQQIILQMPNMPQPVMPQPPPPPPPE